MLGALVGSSPRQRKLNQAAKPFLSASVQEEENWELSLYTFNTGSHSPSHFTERIIRLRCPSH